MVQYPLLDCNVCVAGIDPALLHLGFALLRNGELTAQPILSEKRKGAERLWFIYDAIYALAAPDIQLVAIEGYSFDSENLPFSIGEGGGAIRMALHKRGISYIEVPPSTLKKFVSGNGAAKKDKMISSVAKHYGFETEDDNLADAVGLAMFAGVFSTKDSNRRCELDSVYSLQESLDGTAEARRIHLPRKRILSI